MSARTRSPRSRGSSRQARLPDLQVLFVTVDPAARHARACSPATCGISTRASSASPAIPPRSTASPPLSASASRRVDLPGGGYDFEHTMAILLFDADAREVGVFTPPFDARELAQSLRRVAPRAARRGLTRAWTPQRPRRRHRRCARASSSRCSICCRSTSCRGRSTALARCRVKPVKNALIGSFVRHFRPDMSDARGPRAARLSELQRLLHAQPAARVRVPATPIRGALASPGRRHREPDRAARWHCACCRRRGTTIPSTRCSAARPAWAERFAGGSFATLYLAPLQLSPHPHAGGGHAARRVVRPGKALQRQRGDRGGRAGTLRAQRAGRLRLRGGSARVRAGAGRRSLRRQHRHRMARRCDALQPAPARRSCRSTPAGQPRPARAGRRAGPVQHGLHRHPAAAAGRGGLAARAAARHRRCASARPSRGCACHDESPDAGGEPTRTGGPPPRARCWSCAPRCWRAHAASSPHAACWRWTRRSWSTLR